MRRNRLVLQKGRTSANKCLCGHERRMTQGKHIGTHQQSHRWSHAEPHRIFDDVEREGEEREKKPLSREITSSSTKFSMDEMTSPPLYAQSLQEGVIFSPRQISCANASFLRQIHLPRVRNRFHGAQAPTIFFIVPSCLIHLPSLPHPTNWIT